MPKEALLIIVNICLLSGHLIYIQSSEPSDTKWTDGPHYESDVTETTENLPMRSTTRENKLDVNETTSPLLNATKDELCASTLPLTTIRYEETSMHGSEEPNNYANETTSINITSEYVEELLQRNETMAFLNSIPNHVKRSVITEQLRYCPYSNMCTFSFNLTLPEGNVSAHLECSCSEGNSSRHKPCPDVLDSFGVILTEPFDCFPMYLKDPKIEPDDDRLLYKVIHRCPDSDGNWQLCDTGEGRDRTFVDILPVTDRTSNMIYINMPCVLCNKVKNENLIVWDTTLSCDGREVHEYTTDSEFISFTLQRPKCNLKFSLNERGERAKAMKYSSIIRKCNETRNWKVFDPFISSACLFYENYYFIV